MIWRQLADRTPSVDLDRITVATRRALRDKNTRKALAQTVAHGRATYARFADDTTRSGLTRLARDPKTQDDVSALVRSVANMIDTGTATRARRSRLRSVGIVSALGLALGVFVSRRRRLTHPSVVHERAQNVAEPLNGVVTEAERTLRI